MQYLYILLLLAFAAPALSAQNPKAARTQAAVYLDAYRTDKSKKADLRQACTQIELAAKDSELGQDPKTWRYKGEIYAAIADDERLRADFPTAALTAHDAWVQALTLEEGKLSSKGKPLHKLPNKNVYKDGFEALANTLYNSGVEQLNTGGYTAAYPYFINIHKLPTRAQNVFGSRPPVYRFKEADARRLAGLCAVKTGKLEEGETILRPLLSTTTDTSTLANLYNSLATGAMEQNQLPKARQYLNDARKANPQNYPLLLTDINLSLRERKMAESETLLLQALKMQPNDAELLFALASIYDVYFREKIQPTERKASLSATDEQQGLQFFQKAQEHYLSALKANPRHINSLYSLGILHVNHANYGYKKMESAPKDPQWGKLSDQALSLAAQHLSEAEKVEPTNTSVLFALQMIYQNKGDTAKSEAYKAKLQPK